MPEFNKVVPELKVGDWITVNGFGFRLQEYKEGYGGEVSVTFVSVEESNKLDKQKELASEVS